MTEFRYDAIGFARDGTRLDTVRDLGAAVNPALELGGFDPVPVGSSKDLIGGGAKIMLAQAVEAQGGMPEEDFRALYKTMLAYYSENNAVYTRPYPHAREVVSDLANRGVRLAVVTNKFEEFARSILEQLDFLSPFDAVIGGTSLGKGEDGKYLAKPSPEPMIKAREICCANKPGSRFAFIGDSSYDVKAARGAGVPMVVAAYGYCDAPPHELGGDAVIDSLDGLIPALESL